MKLQEILTTMDSAMERNKQLARFLVQELADCEWSTPHLQVQLREKFTNYRMRSDVYTLVAAAETIMTKSLFIQTCDMLKTLLNGVLQANEQLITHVHYCGMTMTYRRASEQSIPAFQAKQVYKDFPHLCPSDPLSYIPGTALCEFLLQKYDLNKDRDLLNIKCFLDENGRTRDKFIRRSKDAREPSLSRDDSTSQSEDWSPHVDPSVSIGCVKAPKNVYDGTNTQKVIDNRTTLETPFSHMKKGVLHMSGDKSPPGPQPLNKPSSSGLTHAPKYVIPVYHSAPGSSHLKRRYEAAFCDNDEEKNAKHQKVREELELKKQRLKEALYKDTPKKSRVEAVTVPKAPTVPEQQISKKRKADDQAKVQTPPKKKKSLLSFKKKILKSLGGRLI